MSLEMAPGQTLRRMVKQAGNVDRPTENFIREVVGWLGRAMDDEIRLLLGEDAQDRLAVADVDVTVLEMPRRSSQPLEVPGRVPVGAEEVATHVVVDPDHTEASLVQERDAFRADQPAGAGNECGLQVSPRPPGILGPCGLRRS